MDRYSFSPSENYAKHSSFHRVIFDDPSVDRYRKSFQWSDESVVLYAKIHEDYYGGSADCSHLTEESVQFDRADFLAAGDCDKNITDSFLCEMDVTENAGRAEDASEEIHIGPVDWLGNGSHVTCPTGHMTLTFLACDVQSACWASHMDSQASSCGAALTPLPPSFTCGNGVERVPYTLVCDHRSDCSDNSDENFCVFPSCRLLGQLQCTNKQVRLTSVTPFSRPRSPSPHSLSMHTHAPTALGLH